MSNITDTIQVAINGLTQVAAHHNPDAHNIVTPIGETTINGVDYQIQVRYIADKKEWFDEAIAFIKTSTDNG